MISLTVYFLLLVASIANYISKLETNDTTVAKLAVIVFLIAFLLNVYAAISEPQYYFE
jgi:hypothetical protein